MKCSHVKVGEHTAIVCRSGKRTLNRCVKCSKPASLLCDWKIDSYHTCDAPLCPTCTSTPEPGKDLCPRHAEAWDRHPENPKNVVEGQPGSRCSSASCGHCGRCT